MRAPTSAMATSGPDTKPDTPCLLKTTGADGAGEPPASEEGDDDDAATAPQPWLEAIQEHPGAGGTEPLRPTAPVSIPHQSSSLRRSSPKQWK